MTGSAFEAANQQPVSTIEMFNVGLKMRERLEEAWSNETAFQGIDIGPDEPASRGQCGVSSLWGSRELCRMGYDAKFVEGEVVLGDKPLGGFCWIEVAGIIIDLTSDQYGHSSGSLVYVGGSGEEDTPARYIKQAEWDPFAIPHRKLAQRYTILEHNLGHAASRPRRRCLALLGRISQAL